MNERVYLDRNAGTPVQSRGEAKSGIERRLRDPTDGNIMIAADLSR